MTASDRETAPMRGIPYKALAAFSGQWRAKGRSYGSPNQQVDDPKSTADPWVSTHSGTWHTGEFFRIQDEQATVAGRPFDTLSIMGLDATTGGYFARSFENHGVSRHDDVAVNGHVWTFTGKTARARRAFSADGRTQTRTWDGVPRTGGVPCAIGSPVASIDRLVSSTCLIRDQADAASRLALIPFPGRNAR